MTTRWEGYSVEVGPLVTKIDFDPETHQAHAVFIMDRAVKIGSEVDDRLYDLSTKLSRSIQRGESGQIVEHPFLARIARRDDGAVSKIELATAEGAVTALDPYWFDVSSAVTNIIQEWPAAKVRGMVA